MMTFFDFRAKITQTIIVLDHGRSKKTETNHRRRGHDVLVEVRVAAPELGNVQSSLMQI